MANIIKWFKTGLYTVFVMFPYYFYYGLTCLINPKKGSELKYRGRPVIPIVMISLTLTIYFICIFSSSRWYVQKLKINYLTTDILKTTKILEDEEYTTPTEEEDYIPKNSDEYSNISFLSVNFAELISKNSDTVAWLKVNNTNVNSSVVQTTDNSYYLKHDFNKRNNIAGWVYGDYRDDFTHFGNNTIIYAHNMTNRTMFGSLVWCLKESWYQNEENHYIKLSTPNANVVWKIFSIYTINPEVYYLKTYFNDEDEHEEFIEKIKGRSIYNFQEDVDSTDKILTLSTCTDDGTRRVVIHAKMIKAEYR